MRRRTVGSIAVDAFFDTFTCAALFGRLRIPGSPREMIDPRAVDMFWMDQLQSIMTDVKKMIRMARVAAFSGLLFGSVSESTIATEVQEGFRESWPPSVKLQVNARHPQ